MSTIILSLHQWPGFLLFFGFGFFQRKGSRIGAHRAGEGGHAPIDGKPLGGKPLFVFGHHIKQRQLVQIKGDLAQLQTEIGKLIEGELKQLLIVGFHVDAAAGAEEPGIDPEEIGVG